MLFQKKQKIKRWFTLIEMLIVIVIIWILAASLIPRLTSAKWRANDTARKADIQQIAATLVAYQIDHGQFPATRWSINCISWSLNSAGMLSIPLDPNRARTIAGFTSPSPTSCTTAWYYYYFPISKWWIAGAWFALVAATETEWWSNFSTKSNTIDMEDTDVDATYETISSQLCTSFTISSSAWDCNYAKWSDNLRYIYLY